MKFRDAMVSGIAHLAQNRMRAGLSILGILIGIASVLCMMAIGDGARKIVAADIKKLGGANQVQFGTRISIYRKGRLIRRTTERYILEDASAIEATCPEILFALPKNDGFRGYVTSRNGSQVRPYVGVCKYFGSGSSESGFAGFKDFQDGSTKRRARAPRPYVMLISVFPKI